MQKCAPISAIASIVLLLALQPARANDLREIRPLSFGVFSVQNNGSTQSMVIAPDGSAPNPTSGILRFRRGSNAVYEITKLPANTSFTTTIVDTTLTGSAGIPVFDVTDFQVIPANADTPQSDASGNATLQIGATLSTRTGSSYRPGAYRGTYDLMLNF